MSGEEELQLVEAAAYRYARRKGVPPEQAEKISEGVAAWLRTITASSEPTSATTT